MLEILTRIVDGKGEKGDIELLEELCYAVKDGALCGLGQTRLTRCLRRLNISGMNMKRILKIKNALPANAQRWLLIK